MPFCINCGHGDVTRTGDDFTCAVCGYRWDVAHEQANAAYLRARGHTPAEPGGVSPDAGSAEDALFAELGLEHVPGPASHEAGHHLNARLEDGTALDDDWIIDLDTALDAIEGKTVPDLEVLAERHGVDLSGARVKADIIARLLESGRLTVVYAPDGAMVDVE